MRLPMPMLLLPVILAASAVAAPAVNCKSAQSQTELNICAYQSSQAADARLNQTYRALLAKVTPAGRAKLQSAQRAWVTYRDLQCAFETAGTVGGSIHPLIVGGCVESLTRAQTKRLNAQLHCQEGDVSCGGQ